FSGFDPINALLIRDEILELRKKGATVIFSTHNMGSVEELCDNIALINKSQKILDGRVRDIKKTYGNNTYRVAFRGTEMAFTHALWTGADITEKLKEDDVNIYTLKAKPGIKSNQILEAVLPTCELLSFNEVIPTMNDIFIRKVNEGNEATGTNSSFTE
ncbi:MAG: DUF4162 domain-containing protein, partial [Bacteroidia bacterium]|nr:DUF4162 domain-containing protein [Bacteroidia bacterium]